MEKVQRRRDEILKEKTLLGPGFKALTFHPKSSGLANFPSFACISQVLPSTIIDGCPLTGTKTNKSSPRLLNPMRVYPILNSRHAAATPIALRNQHHLHFLL